MDDSHYRKQNWKSILRASGPDAREFLQGQFSQDLAKLGPGEAVYGLWLDRKGKIVADSYALCESEERFWIASCYGPEAVVQRRLESHLIMEEVELEAFGERSQGLCVVGESGVGRVCERLGIAYPEAGRFAGGEGVFAFRGRRGVEPCLEILATIDDAKERLEGLASDLKEAGSPEMDESDLDRWAIEGRVPVIGRGFGESDLPQELGLEKEAVSFRKGCYLGQEVMARLQTMGRARKRLSKVSINGLDTVDRSSLPLELSDEAGKKHGELRMVAYSESGGGIGLAVLNTRFEGERLSCGNAVVEVAD